MITRATGIKEFVKRLDPLDVVIFVGERICQEAYVYDADNHLYIINDYPTGLSFALGVALATDKRVFIIMSDNALLQDVSVFLQMAVSERKNLYCILFHSGYYLSAGGHPNIYHSISHPQGVFFRMGFISFVFDKYFSTPGGLKEMKNVIDTLIGPAFISVEVQKRLGRYKEIDKPMKFFLARFKNHLNTEGTALFEPPIIGDIRVS